MGLLSLIPSKDYYGEDNSVCLFTLGLVPSHPTRHRSTVSSPPICLNSC